MQAAAEAKLCVFEFCNYSLRALCRASLWLLAFFAIRIEPQGLRARANEFRGQRIEDYLTSIWTEHQTLSFSK
jgi:hypothetical protein